MERFHLAVLGGGAAGLSLAAGAARLGLSTVLFEPGEMGGDCLNRGCVPSKALLATAVRVARRRAAGQTVSREAAFLEAMSEVRRAIAAIAPHDSQERFEGLGATVVRAPARFLDARTLSADGRRFQAKRFALATGSEPIAPAIEGLATSDMLTSDTVWSLEAPPEALTVLGGGPIGVELSQAFARLGVQVTLIEQRSRLLPGAPAFVSDPILEALKRDGVEVRLSTRIVAGARENGALALQLSTGDRVVAGALVAAAGRRPRVEGLGLAEAGIETDAEGVRTDARLRTTNPRVFALGDATAFGGLTNAAGFHASVALRNIAFRMPARADRTPPPQAVYVDPEAAWIGLSEEDARGQGHSLRPATWSFKDNDRAQAEGETGGEARLTVTAKGRLLGAAAVGPGAGEIIALAALAMHAKVKLSALASFLPAYPTRSEILKRAAGAWFEPVVFGRSARRAVSLLARLP